MHTVSLGLFIWSFWMKDCHENIYPLNFIFVTILIIVHTTYDIFLYCNDYMIDWENLPPMSDDRLRYNQELFRKQSKCLLIACSFFGFLSILTVATGFFIVNRSHEEDTN